MAIKQTFERLYLSATVFKEITTEEDRLTIDKVISLLEPLDNRGAISLIVKRHTFQSTDLRAERVAILAFFEGGHWQSAAEIGRALDYAPNEIVLRLRHLASEGILQLGTRDPNRQPGRGNELFARLRPIDGQGGPNSYVKVDEKEPPPRTDIVLEQVAEVPSNWPGASGSQFDQQVEQVIELLQARGVWMTTADIAEACEISSSRTSEVLRYLAQRYQNVERRRATGGRGLEFRVTELVADTAGDQHSQARSAP